jgi:hypothetical protein
MDNSDGNLSDIHKELKKDNGSKTKPAGNQISLGTKEHLLLKEKEERLPMPLQDN